MSGQGEERAKLDFGGDLDDEDKPALDADAIRAVSEQAGFVKTETPATPAKPKTTTPRKKKAASKPKSEQATDLPKRARRKTGRIHQFATRLDEQTYRAIYEIADRENITLAEVITNSVTALCDGTLPELPKDSGTTQDGEQ